MIVMSLLVMLGVSIHVYALLFLPSYKLPSIASTQEYFTSIEMRSER